MRVRKSTVEQVKERFAQKEVEKEDKKKQYDFQERLKEAQEEVGIFILTGVHCFIVAVRILQCATMPVWIQELRMIEYRKQKRLEARKRKRGDTEADDAGVDPNFAAMMGFGSFGTSKKPSWSPFLTTTEPICII